MLTPENMESFLHIEQIKRSGSSDNEELCSNLLNLKQENTQTEFI